MAIAGEDAVAAVTGCCDSADAGDVALDRIHAIIESSWHWSWLFRDPCAAVGGRDYHWLIAADWYPKLWRYSPIDWHRCVYVRLNCYYYDEDLWSWCHFDF